MSITKLTKLLTSYFEMGLYYYVVPCDSIEKYLMISCIDNIEHIYNIPNILFGLTEYTITRRYIECDKRRTINKMDIIEEAYNIHIYRAQEVVWQCTSLSPLPKYPCIMFGTNMFMRPHIINKECDASIFRTYSHDDILPEEFMNITMEITSIYPSQYQWVKGQIFYKYRMIKPVILHNVKYNFDKGPEHFTKYIMNSQTDFIIYN